MSSLEKGSTMPPTVERQLATSVAEIRPEVRRKRLSDGIESSSLIIVRNYFTEGSEKAGPIGILLAREMYEIGPTAYLEGVQHFEVTENGTDPTVASIPPHTTLKMGYDGISYSISNSNGPLPNRSSIPYKVTPISAEEHDEFSKGLNSNPRATLEEMYKLIAGDSKTEGFKLVYVGNRARLLIPENYASMPITSQNL